MEKKNDLGEYQIKDTSRSNLQRMISVESTGKINRFFAKMGESYQ